MADRTSAGIFARVFEYLSLVEDPINRHEFARFLYGESRRCDFHPCQMDCDDALVKLGLARTVDDEIKYNE